MEEKSFHILRRTLPDHWVLREYRPDYAIDLTIEVFEPPDHREGVFETLGEWMFVQLKSAKTTRVQKRVVLPRENVEKFAPVDRSAEKTTHDEPPRKIDVIPFKIDTDELLTIQSFGVAAPILLLLVTLDTERVYFICLNDLIDKVLIHEHSTFATQKTKTIHIPLANEISQLDDSLMPLRFIAKRAKMYAAFVKFSYQQGTVARLIDSGSLKRDLALVLLRHGEGRPPRLKEDRLDALATIRQFLQIIKMYDFWQTTDMWPPVAALYGSLIDVEERLYRFIDTGDPDGTVLDTQLPPAPLLLEQAISTLWDRLRNLGHMHEEICREWFLLTYLGDLTSP